MRGSAQTSCALRKLPVSGGMKNFLQKSMHGVHPGTHRQSLAGVAIGMPSTSNIVDTTSPTGHMRLLGAVNPTPLRASTVWRSVTERKRPAKIPRCVALDSLVVPRIASRYLFIVCVNVAAAYKVLGFNELGDSCFDEGEGTVSICAANGVFVNGVPVPVPDGSNIWTNSAFVGGGCATFAGAESTLEIVMRPVVMTWFALLCRLV